MFNTAVLYGDLKEEYGEEHQYAVATPREMFRALSVNKPGFKEKLVQFDYRLFRQKEGSDVSVELEQVDLDMNMEGCRLHIMPELEGSGRGAGKIIAGVALVGASIITSGAATAVMAGYGAAGAGAALSGAAFAGISFGTLALFGASLALGGIAMTLAPSPEAFDPNEAEDEKASFTFRGAVNVGQQGQPIPVLYGGPLRAGSVVISSGYSVENILAGGAAGNVDNSAYDTSLFPGSIITL